MSHLLSTWNSFYATIGSSAAALTGLMFVVITLVTDSDRRASKSGISTFSTPTVVHFCCVLFTAAIMLVPFRSFVPIAILLGLAGAAGMYHVVRTARGTLKLDTYEPDAEDWTWNVALPFIAYAGLIGSALALHSVPARALFATAAAAVLLIFIGIHNAWDVVTYLATSEAEAKPDPPAG